MKEKDNKSKVGKIALLLILVAVFAGILAVVAWQMAGKESTITVENDTSTTTYLACSAANVEGSFFAPEGESKSKHEIKFTFAGDLIDKISYNYTGYLENTDKIDTKLTELHADYNIYMSKEGVPAEALSPTWNVIDDNLVVNLFIKREYFSAVTAKFIFMTTSEYIVNKDANLEKLQKFYKSKGFTCRDNA